MPVVADAPLTSNHFENVIPFKVQVKFDIPLFEGQVDVDSLDKWLNVLEGFFSIHNFSSKENVTFALLTMVPHVKNWCDTYCEK